MSAQRDGGHKSYLRRARCVACAGSLLAYASVLLPRASMAQSPSQPDSADAVTAAKEIFRRLAGTWTFEWRSGDRVGFTGTRTYRMLPDSLRMTFEETFDRPSQSGTGMLWYHPQLRRFFSMEVMAPGSEGSLLTGTLDRRAGSILFDLVRIDSDSVPINRGMVRSRLTVPITAPHTWSRWDDAWVVTFRRKQGTT